MESALFNGPKYLIKTTSTKRRREVVEDGYYTNPETPTTESSKKQKREEYSRIFEINDNKNINTQARRRRTVKSKIQQRLNVVAGAVTTYGEIPYNGVHVLRKMVTSPTGIVKTF